jgi:hypothetical protein
MFDKERKRNWTVITYRNSGRIEEAWVIWDKAEHPAAMEAMKDPRVRDAIKSGCEWVFKDGIHKVL